MTLQKALALIILICAFASMLTGCSNQKSEVSESDDTAIFLPESTATSTSVEAELPAPVDELLDAPMDELLPTVTVTPAPTTFAESFTYTSLSDTSFGFTFVYPSSWENVPGKNTACFREKNSEYGFPARIALTKKRMPHKPTQNQVYTEFQEYAKIIYAQYEHSTFSYGAVKRDATFLGQQAFEVSYLAYAGDIEVEGYLICAAVDYTIYVFHFCAAYDEYQELGPVLTRIRDSIKLVS